MRRRATRSSKAQWVLAAATVVRPPVRSALSSDSLDTRLLCALAAAPGPFDPAASISGDAMAPSCRAPVQTMHCSNASHSRHFTPGTATLLGPHRVFSSTPEPTQQRIPQRTRNLPWALQTGPFVRPAVAAGILSSVRLSSIRGTTLPTCGPVASAPLVKGTEATAIGC